MDYPSVMLINFMRMVSRNTIDVEKEQITGEMIFLFYTSSGHCEILLLDNKRNLGNANDG